MLHIDSDEPIDCGAWAEACAVEVCLAEEDVPDESATYAVARTGLLQARVMSVSLPVR